MKKIFTLFAVTMALTTMVNAQTTGGPDAFGYIWRTNADPNGPTFNWIDITQYPSAVNITNLQDDNKVGPFSVQIPFTYYWYQPTNFYIGSNGYITFNNQSVAHPFPVIPTPAGSIDNYLGCMVTDLTMVDNQSQIVPGATCHYWVNPALDTLIVSWQNFPFWDPIAPGYQGSNSFQIILSAVDSSITYQYQNQTSVSVSTTDFITTGIESVSGTYGLQHLYLQYPTSGTSVKYYYPASVTLAINDASTDYVNNDGTRGLFLTKSSSAYQSVAQVANTGNQPLAAFNVESKVLNALNQVQVRDTLQTGALAVSQTQLLTFPDVFSPTVAGTFRHITTTQLVGDITPPNNARELELRVVDTTAAQIVLSYNNGQATTTGISWNGGAGGIGYYFKPSFYPCNITALEAYIVDDPNVVGYTMQVYKDDGPGGIPGTLLATEVIAPGSVIIGVTNNTVLSASVPILSDGFYVAWVMGGAGIVLGEDGTGPYSNRCFEILGAATNPLNWSEYRAASATDPIINAIVGVPVSTYNPDASANAFGVCMPNPANSYTRIDYSLAASAKSVLCTIYDVDGKLVAKKSFGQMGAGKGSLYVDLSNVNQGMYIVKISDGENTYRTKLSVVK